MRLIKSAKFLCFQHKRIEDSRQYVYSYGRSEFIFEMIINNVSNLYTSTEIFIFLFTIHCALLAEKL